MDVHKLSSLVRKLAAGISLVPYIEPMSRSGCAQVVGRERSGEKRDLSDQTLGLLQLLDAGVERETPAHLAGVWGEGEGV